MTVELDYSVVNDINCSQSDFETLIRILTNQNRYQVVLTDKRILDSDFVNNSSSDLKELLNIIYTSSINVSDDCDCTVKNQTVELKAKEFDVNEAISFFSTPLEIVLENCDNDSYLVSAVFKHFASYMRFEEKLQKKWVKFSGNGGCSSIGAVINRELRSNGYKPKMLRFYVILDSDKHFKTQPVTKYDNLKPILTENNIKYHIWEKRSAENYLPTEAFESFRSVYTENWINAYSYLPDDQKDYIDISGGYSRDAGKLADKSVPDRSLLKTTNPEEADFIKDVSDTNFGILWNGLEIGDFKSEFPKAFESRYVYKETLENRIKQQSNPNEFDCIIKEIEKLL